RLQPVVAERLRDGAEIRQSFVGLRIVPQPDGSQSALPLVALAFHGCLLLFGGEGEGFSRPSSLHVILDGPAGKKVSIREFLARKWDLSIQPTSETTFFNEVK